MVDHSLIHSVKKVPGILNLNLAEQSEPRLVQLSLITMSSLNGICQQVCLQQAIFAMTEFCFMASIGAKRVPRSANFSFGKKKKSQRTKSGEYGGCSRTFFECFSCTFLTEYM